MTVNFLFIFSADGTVRLRYAGCTKSRTLCTAVIGKNYKWSEGPVWVPAKQMLLFSAVRENKIYKWDGKDSPVVYLTPSGYTDTAYRDGENGSNGLALDKDGRLLLCQSGNRQVVRLGTSLDAPKPEFTVLAPNYPGKEI